MVSSRKKKLSDVGDQPRERPAEACPHCGSREFVRRGVRRNKRTAVQLYLCRASVCGRTFTGRTRAGGQFPWGVVLDALSYHNLGYSFAECGRILAAKHGASPAPETIALWYERHTSLCRFERLRPYAMKILAAWRHKSGERVDMVETTTLAHRQLYRFRYHRPKLILMLEEYGNRNFGRLMEYLDSVATETPHQYFSEGERMSEVRSRFNRAEMVVKAKKNFANDLARFVLPGVPRNKDRHEALQRFMIANDSVTVATEVPVYIRREDIEHLQSVLKFTVVGEEGIVFRGRKGRQRSGAEVAKADVATGTGDKGTRHSVDARRSAGNFGSGIVLPRVLTGHIDIVQVRNGQVHILDYKPSAAKEKPIEQLTWYALALSRLTGLRLFEFKCAWFDEQDYFEFYPLHVVKKLRRARVKRVRYRDGSAVVVPHDDLLTIV